ncbi:MAG: transcriptional regulator [Planctomycetota bacterium]|nr:transcriptional regulator [Planctomycetota bacterium]
MSADRKPEPDLVSRAAEGLAGIDRLVHEPARLAVLAILAVVEEADFVFVQRRAGLTAGNLATHLARLEEAGFVRITKTFENRRPCTLLALTEGGRSALTSWRKSMGRLLDLLP